VCRRGKIEAFCLLFCLLCLCDLRVLGVLCGNAVSLPPNYGAAFSLSTLIARATVVARRLVAQASAPQIARAQGADPSGGLPLRGEG